MVEGPAKDLGTPLDMGNPGRRGRDILPCSALLLAGLISQIPAAVADLNLAEDGVSRYTIVIPSDPSPAEEHAAAELVHYIKVATGAALPVVGNPDAPASRRLLVGATDLSRGLVGAETDIGPEEDAFIVRTVGDDIILLGAGDRGTLYAVYSFLQDPIGCRWLSWSSSFGVSHSLSAPSGPIM